MAQKRPSNLLVVSAGDRFGRLVIVSEATPFEQPSGQRARAFTCKCDCGTEKTIRLSHLKNGRVKSCGCIMPSHGMSHSKIYTVWRGMINRATSKSHINANRYVQRGITVCDEWRSSFIAFKEWAQSNGFGPGLTLDRRDNSKGYFPDNCRFVTPTINNHNRDFTIRVSFEGDVLPLAGILTARNMMANYAAVTGRIKRGWNPEEAIKTPIRKGDYGKNRKKVA